MEDYIAQVHAAKKKKALIGIAAAAVCLLVFLIAFAGGNDGELSEADALNRAPALALTDTELALADTILDHADFRNALNHDLVENSTTFTLEQTQAVIGSVIPADAEVGEIAVVGAVVIIGYRQPQYRIILEYVDADRSGKVDSIRKTLTPIIDGISTGCYQVDCNLTTGKIVYTYTSF